MTTSKAAAQRPVAICGANVASVNEGSPLRLDSSAHVLFQISTSGALVAGVYSGLSTAKTVLEHGDFGLGAFADLDGEMVIVDGRAFRVQGTGQVSEARTDAETPFAAVTRFYAEVDVEVGDVSSLMDLKARCDAYRMSENVFYAFRLDGQFDRILARAPSPAKSGVPLRDVVNAQSEFGFADVTGTLVGFWSPRFSETFGIPGYHFHFLSDDRIQGGHLLECSASRLRLRAERLTELHLALPQSEAFLRADLNGNPANEIAYAEEGR
jgi:acetolactate decarboxylase